MLAPRGVFRKAHVPSCRKPGRCERVGILNEQVSRRPPVYSRIEVELHAKMNLRAFKSNEAIRAAVPVAYTEAKPANATYLAGPRGAGQRLEVRRWPSSAPLKRAGGDAANS